MTTQKVHIMFKINEIEELRQKKSRSQKEEAELRAAGGWGQKADNVALTPCVLILLNPNHYSIGQSEVKSVSSPRPSSKAILILNPS